MQKTHIYEVDYLRVFGVISIVIIHAFGFYLAMPVSGPVVRISQELTVNLLRFARYVFMFVTGMVLFYTYNDRKLNVTSFFRRRLKNLVIPYAVWTGIYLLIQHWAKMMSWPNAAAFIISWAQNIMDGQGYYTLYYILVAIQFYLFFPLLLTAFKPRRPGLVAGIILVAGLVLYTVYHYLFEFHPSMVTALAGGSSGAVTWFLDYKDRILLSYLPIYLLGGLVGIYLEAARTWLREHVILITTSLLLGMGLVTGEYFYLYRHLGQSWWLTVSVFKPSIYLYSLGIISASFLLARLLERWKALRSLISLLAANSLGIYLMHPAVEYVIHSYLWRYQSLPGTVLVILDPALAVAVSCLISHLLGGSRYTRFIVGEAGNLPRRNLSLAKNSGSGAKRDLVIQKQLPPAGTTTGWQVVNISNMTEG